MQKVTENYLSKVTRYFYFVTSQHWSWDSRPVLPTLKLGTYNGSTCIRTFLSKFENCSDYYEWNDKERLCHLRASLEGPAGQVLWDAGHCTSADALIRMLKNRFKAQYTPPTPTQLNCRVELRRRCVLNSQL